MQTVSTIIRMLVATPLLSLSLHGQVLNTIYSFGHNDRGGQPSSGVVVASGNLFGVTPIRSTKDGALMNGVAFELMPPATQGGAWSEIVLDSFPADEPAGGSPAGGLEVGPSGALYGVTGAVSGGGTVYRLTPPTGSGQKWRKTVLHTFGESGDGTSPAAAPILSSSHSLYGTSKQGGAFGGGIVYRLAPPSAQNNSWTEAILYNFPGYPGDGTTPTGELAFGDQGTLYGTTMDGGDFVVGTVFQLSPPTSPGGTWTETVIHTFGLQGGDEGFPNGVVRGPGGVLYGTTMGGLGGKACAGGCGTIFELTPPIQAGDPWTETVLHTFAGNQSGDGSQPNSVPVFGPNGVLYGTTAGGGSPDSGSFGTIYEMIPPATPDGSWTETIVYRFTGGADGWEPNAVAFGPDGNLYGTTATGGVSSDGVRNQGTVFQLVLH